MRRRAFPIIHFNIPLFGRRNSASGKSSDQALDPGSGSTSTNFRQVLNGVIIGKLRNLDEVTGELRSLGPLTTERLATEWVVRRAVERCLQVGVEIVLDVCHRILALSGKTPAATSREAIEDCVALGVLSRLEPYGEMVGFRNMVVHRYDRIDPTVLVDITNNHLQDFDRFRDEVLAYCAR